MNFQEAVAVAQRELRINLSCPSTLETMAELNDALTALGRLHQLLPQIEWYESPSGAQVGIKSAGPKHDCSSTGGHHSYDCQLALARQSTAPQDDDYSEDNEIDVPEYGMHAGAVIREYD